MRQDGGGVWGGAVGPTALEEQKGAPWVGARQPVVEPQGPPVVPNRLVEAPRLRERDRHVLQNAGIVGMVAQRQAVGGERRLVVALALERECLVQVVEALGLEVIAR